MNTITLQFFVERAVKVTVSPSSPQIKLRNLFSFTGGRDFGRDETTPLASTPAIIVAFPRVAVGSPGALFTNIAGIVMIDLRSDTVTRPSEAMRTQMSSARVGDDVFADDPTVNELQEYAANLVGKEAALFVPSGTQSNLIALMSHCRRGDEYIVGQHAHTYKYEGGGAAVLGSIQPQPLHFEDDGTLNLEEVKRYIKPDDPHFACTRLLCLENTTGGKVLPLDYFPRARSFVDENGLGLHLDGARVFNAAVWDGVPVSDITGHFDSVSICLSKGLGAPVGSLLCGSEEFIHVAHRWRKMVGGGMRQAGIVAAGGLYALRENVSRIAEDHENAAALAEGLRGVSEITVQAARTNMVFFNMKQEHCDALERHAAAQGVLMKCAPVTRLVTHLDVSPGDVRRSVDVVKGFFAIDTHR